MSLHLGVIADDYTGATDIAVTLVNQGMTVLQVLGVPEAPVDLAGIDAVVVALKSRTIAAEDAVAQALAAEAWLSDRGTSQIFFKYCSTFDSTDKGNIGPVADALRAATGAGLAFICPAFPANARSVYMGHLFVGEVLLAESPMKNHPLTPMRDSSLVRLMEAQAQGGVGLIPLATVRQGAAAVAEAARRLTQEGRAYAVVDAVDDADLRTIGAAAARMKLVTGGSGVAMGLPANFGITPAGSDIRMPDVPGRSVVLAGSCSAATRGQLDHVAASWPMLKLDVHRIARGDDVARDAVAWASASNAPSPPVIYASSDPGDVASIQSRYGVEAAGEMIETCFAQIAAALAQQGFGRFVVAGGETSGAVLGGLGASALHIHAEIAPGVPWTTTAGDRPIALALKSGNFGGPDFFDRAFQVLP